MTTLTDDAAKVAELATLLTVRVSELESQNASKQPPTEEVITQLIDVFHGGPATEREAMEAVYWRALALHRDHPLIQELEKECTRLRIERDQLKEVIDEKETYINAQEDDLDEKDALLSKIKEAELDEPRGFSIDPNLVIQMCAAYMQHGQAKGYSTKGMTAAYQVARDAMLRERDAHSIRFSDIDDLVCEYGAPEYVQTDDGEAWYWKYAGYELPAADDLSELFVAGLQLLAARRAEGEGK